MRDHGAQRCCQDAKARRSRFRLNNTEPADKDGPRAAIVVPVRRSDAVGRRTHLAHREVTALELAQIGEKVARQGACRDRDLP